MTHHANALKRKLGPLPVWGWALVTGVVLYVVRNRNAAGGLLAGGSATGSSTAPGDPLPLSGPPPLPPRGRKHKPPRRRKHKIPRPRRHKPVGHGHPKAPAGVEEPKPKHHHPHGPHHRDRTHIGGGGSRTAFAIASRLRGRHEKAGLHVAAVQPTNSRQAQRSEVRHPIEQGRTHTGDFHTAPHFRERPATAPVEGRTSRTRTLTGPAEHAVDRVAPTSSAKPQPTATRAPSRTPAPSRGVRAVRRPR